MNFGYHDITDPLKFLGPHVSMTCSDAKNKFGELMDMAQKQPILIEKYRRPFLVVLSYDDYKRMQKQAVNYTVK